MRRILKSKKGVTILEGLIALTLLALVATGTFAVLLSVSRKSSTPDIREEMILAVERASQRLQAFAFPVQSSSNTNLRGNWKWEDVLCSGDNSSCTVSSDHVYATGLCGDDTQMLSTSSNPHGINCMLPPICDSAQSSFQYTVETVTPPLPRPLDQAKQEGSTSTLDVSGQPLYKISFYIKCNGFTL